MMDVKHGLAGQESVLIGGEVIRRTHGAFLNRIVEMV